MVLHVHDLSQKMGTVMVLLCHGNRISSIKYGNIVTVMYPRWRYREAQNFHYKNFLEVNGNCIHLIKTRCHVHA